MTRAVLSLSQVVSCASEVGVAAAAVPPPVVPVARPNAVPTASALSATDARATTKTMYALKEGHMFDVGVEAALYAFYCMGSA